MGYGEQLARLKLVQMIPKSQGRDDLSDTDVLQLQAMTVAVADQIGDLLAAIPMTFKQYTKHDLLHARNVIDLMGRFIPARTLKHLNGIELTVLVLVALLHDFGMYVEEDEKQRILDGEEFLKLLDALPEKKHAVEEAESAGRHGTASAIRDSVLADYFRKLHPERARENIRRYLPGVLRFREYDLTDDIATVCESHGWGVFESADPRHPERTIEKLKQNDPIYGIPFNPQYIAACLRLADIMDFDRSRTPLALLRTVSDVKSLAEWKKHLQIRGWTITDRDVSFRAKCTHPEHFVAVMEFLDWIDVELRDCRRLMRKQPPEVAERSMLNLPTTVDRFDVEMADHSYAAGAFRFELDYERIMKLLMDKSLYPDPSLFLRELLQNSLDACRVRLAMAQSEDAAAAYEPRITVWDYSADASDPRIVFQDNGIGMSKAIIEKYFMRVGRSYYRSTEFEIERTRLRDKKISLEATSQFGIGFLSCFMVGDRIEIETYNGQGTPLRVSIEGPTKYFTIQSVEQPARPHFRVQGATREEDGPPVYSGTRVTVHLRPGIELKTLEVLDRFAANTEFAIEVIQPGEVKRIQPLRWETLIVGPAHKREAVPKYEKVSDALLEFVTPMFVPLETYDFCEGLRGKLWFWMLRGEDGEAVPDLGYLQISTGLKVVGFPNICSAIKNAGYQLKAADGIPEDAIRPQHAKSVAEFNRQWCLCPPEEQRMVVHWLSEKEEREGWYSEEGIPNILAACSFDWVKYPFDFEDYCTVRGPEWLALHGIEIPAGITYWDPMIGAAGRVHLEQSGVAYCIDVRTRVPTPAASRLFLDPTEGLRVGVPLRRALLRFAMETLDITIDQRWRRWFDNTFEQIFYAHPVTNYVEQAIRSELDLIRATLKLQIVDTNHSVEMSLDEARNAFGRWVPIWLSTNQPEQAAEDSVRNHLLLFGHPIRHRDNLVEVDLDTYTGEYVEWE